MKTKNLKIKKMLKKQIRFVCNNEMNSLKPGNVHKYSAGHGMNVKDFIKSGEIISNYLTNNKYNLGKKILNSVIETKKKIRKNTNLGIILMLSPIITVVEKEGILTKKKLLKKIKSLLAKQNTKNSYDIFKAISIATPGGLGFSKKYDVNKLPRISLYKAMEYSKKKDLIAKQYCSGFKDILEVGIPAYDKFYKKWGKVNWALTGVYLTFLKKFNDSHIIRKNGIKIAINVKKQAKKYYNILKNYENMKIIEKKLLFFDKMLKNNEINPGTTADLTVATLLLELVTKKQ